MVVTIVPVTEFLYCHHFVTCQADNVINTLPHQKLSLKSI